MFVDSKRLKSNLGFSGRTPVEVPAMLPVRAPTIVPPRAPTMVPVRLERAPTIVPPRAVEETLIVSAAIHSIDLKRYISFSLSILERWAEDSFHSRQMFQVTISLSTLVPLVGGRCKSLARRPLRARLRSRLARRN